MPFFVSQASLVTLNSSLRSDFIKYNEWYTNNKQRIEQDANNIIGTRFSVYLNENGKFNTFARPEDNENPVQKLGEYSGHVVNIIKIFSDENKYNKDILRMVVYETVVNKMLAKLLRQPKD